MTNRQATLGDRVKCKVTGFIGIVTTQATHLAGCDRLWVEPPVGEDGKSLGDAKWLDIDMVEIVEPQVVGRVRYERHKPGGFDLPPSR